jgi:hypothetical protein
MDFGQPHRVEPPPLGRVDLGERLGKGFFLTGAGRALKLVKHAKFERHSAFSFSPRGSDRAATRPASAVADGARTSGCRSMPVGPTH